MRETADAVIIGGGVIGASIAYYLAQRRFGSITLLERDSLGSGSTGRSVASIDLLTFQPHAVELYARSAAFFAECDALLDAECGFVQTGSLILAGPEQEKGLVKAVKQMQAAGVTVETLSLEALEALEPMIDLAGVAAASFAPAAGYADPVLTTQALAHAARRLGVDIQQGREVIRLHQHEERVTGVETTTGPITTDVVVVAAGAWSGTLLEGVGIELGLQTVSHPVVSLRRPPDFGPPHHSLVDLSTGIYARPETGDLTLLGSIDPSVGYDPILPDEGPGYVKDDYLMWTMERLVHRFPALEASEIGKGWAGIVSISPDWKSIIGRWPQMPGLFCATGFSGQGFQMAPAAGELLAGLIAGDQSATRHLAPFAPTRFTDDQLLQTEEERSTYGLLG